MVKKTTDAGIKKYFGIFESREAIVNELAQTSYSNNAEAERAAWLENNPLFPEEKEILFAAYDYEDYSGSAVMLFKKNGKLYEYTGSHCSCNGLEDSVFSAGETSWEALALRNPEGELYGYGHHSAEAVEAVKQLVAKNAKNAKNAKKARK